MDPKFTFNVIQSDYPITFGVMLFTAFITSYTTVRIKSKVEFAEGREQRTEVLYEINKKLLVTRGLDKIIDLTNEYIVKIFGRTVIFYTKDPQNGTPGILKTAAEDSDASFLLSKEETAVAHWVFINQKRAGSGTDTLMNAKAYYMPVIFQGNVLGVLGISCTNGFRIDQSNRSFMRRITSLVAMALERQRLSDEQRSILVETEKEKMRSNLLRAISHDLRTPLTGILGASSAILENKDSLDEVTKEQLISHIKEDSQWLIRMVENLLSVTRINEDTANVTKTPEAAEEIIAAAIGRIRKRYPDQKINVRVPEELLMVPMDGTLIEQVIINLIENAIKHSGETEIKISLTKQGNTALFEVCDNGEGIPEQDFPYLFETYVPNGKRTSDSSRGMGIGLSICMSIVKAHHGKMEAANREDGGAVFRFTLPLADDKVKVKNRIKVVKNHRSNPL
jgi:two-component system sensor histidine kinase KdpD